MSRQRPSVGVGVGVGVGWVVPGAALAPPPPDSTPATEMIIVATTLAPALFMASPRSRPEGPARRECR
jgi:hypothetical protein